MFSNIKSLFIFRFIYTHLKEINYLKIFRYNKEIQKRTGISIKDYKKYNDIALEITPIEAKLRDELKDNDKMYLKGIKKKINNI